MINTLALKSYAPFESMRQVFGFVTIALFASGAQAGNQYVEYQGAEGPGKGQRIVLISGDEEYRSEEALPQLAKILSKAHGFDCTMLFAIDPKTGIVNPNHRQNIFGLEKLKDADLMILFTRRRDLPAAQLQLIEDYLKSGRPVIGLRTATHAFMPETSAEWAHYSDTYNGEKKEWEGGLGRLVLGEKWISHHGNHKHESTRGILAPAAEDDPILRGIRSGDLWCPSDVYGVRLPLPGDSKPLVLGQVIARKGEYDENDRFYGMRPDDGPAVPGAKNDPMMPIAWTKTYQIPGGKRGKAFMTTVGASVDLLNEATRRLIVNAVYWSTGLEDRIPPGGARVDLVGKFDPTKFEFRKDDYWTKRKLTIDELQKDAAAARK